MKKLILLLCLTLGCLVAPCNVLAYTAGEIVDSSGGSSGGTTQPDDHPAYSVYTPKVTLLHNANALCAKSGESIYYVPTLSDVPLNMEAYVTDCSDGVNKHNFAYVYSGYFDSDAQLVTISADGDSAEAHTSQNIETAYISNTALKDIGYDLLLIEDSYDMVVTGGTKADISNRHIAANDTELTAKYVVMDIYKALGAYEYDIKFCFTKDTNFSANSSPILNEITVLTSQSGTKGLDTTESRTDVAVSRTNADLYWNRFDKDGISRALNSVYDTNGSQIVYLSTPITRESKVTFGQFCNIAVSLMNLYGEEVLSESEYREAIRTYSSEIAAINCSNEVENTSAIYLLVKGILNPDSIKDIDWDAPVRLLDISGCTYDNSNSILDVLGRISNPDRRIIAKSAPMMDSTLAAAGYGEVEVGISSLMTNYVEYSTDSAFMYDYLVEVNTYNTHICKYGNNSISNTEIDSHVLNTSATAEESVSNSDTYKAFSNMVLIVDTQIYKSADSLADCYNNNTNNFFYNGITSIDGKDYYHFKIRKWWGNKSISFDFLPTGNEVLVEDKVPIVLTNTDGGIYSFNNGSYTRQSFSEASFEESYIDSSSKISTNLDTNYTTLVFYMSQSGLSKQVLSNYNDGTFTWTNICSDTGILYDRLITICNTTNNHTTMLIASGTTNDNYDRVEITTDNPAAVKNSRLFKQYSDGEYYTSVGFYRAAGANSLLVSYDYLKQKGLVTGLKEVSDGVYVLTAGKYKTNVTILKDKGYIIVGDTVFPNLEGESLIVKTNSTYYINYRCCLGWAGQFSIVSTDECVMAIPLNQLGISVSDIKEDVVSVATFFPSALTKTLYSELTYGGINYKGFNLAGSYALAPYVVVMTEDVTDYLFVWHRNNVVSTSGETTYTISDETDTQARNKFKELTGISIDKQHSYSLVMFPLHEDNMNNPNGFVFTNIEKRSAKGTRTATMGWFYDPPVYDNALTALDTYASISSSQAIPIFGYRRSEDSIYYYDANVNVCAEASGSNYLPLGTMPSYIITSDTSKESYYATITPNCGTVTNKIASESTKSYPLYTAPVGTFAQLKGMGTVKAGSITAGSIYFGTSKCNIRENKVTLSGRETSFNASSDAVCTYMSNDSAAVYTVTEDSTALGDFLSNIDLSVGYAISDPSNLVDWDKFTFERLTANLDAWSTVVLIFVLNILPRVGLFLFFILITLSLVADGKLLRMFCERWFDVFSFLTAGHLSVTTIDTKRVVFISLICVGLFMMVMDGTLFNFIIWVSKIWVELYQR